MIQLQFEFKVATGLLVIGFVVIVAVVVVVAAVVEMVVFVVEVSPVDVVLSC